MDKTSIPKVDSAVNSSTPKVTSADNSTTPIVETSNILSTPKFNPSTLKDDTSNIPSTPKSNLLTPKFNHRRRSRFVTPSSASSYKSPLLNKAVKKIEFDPTKASVEELKDSTLKLWQKNEDLKKEIASLKDEGHEEEHLKWYINKLHEYNDIKDVAQNIMGRIAVFENTTVREIHEHFDMADSD